MWGWKNQLASFLTVNLTSQPIIWNHQCNGVMLFLRVFFIQEHRVVVRIDSWESTSLYPNGHSVRVLGRAGELETEVQTILIENCIHAAPFSDAQVR